MDLVAPAPFFLPPAAALVYQIARFHTTTAARLDEDRLDSATVAITARRQSRGGGQREEEQMLKVLNALLYLIYHYRKKEQVLIAE